MPGFAMGRELAGLGGLFNRFVAAPLTGAALFNQGRAGSSLHRALLSTPSTRNTDAGKALGKALGIAPGIANLENEMRYMDNQLQRGSLPYLGNEMRYTTNELSQGRNPYGRPLSGLSNLPANYRGDELQLAARARADQILRGGSGAGGSVGGGNMGGYVPLATSRQAPADRAYQQELSRTAQMTAQDPELLRYETARAAAKTQEEMNSVRDMGLAMWQERYGKTDMGKPGGAIGSTNPLMRSTFGYQTGMSPGDVAKTITNPSVVPVSPGEAPYQMGDLGTRVTSETGYDSAAYGLSPELIKAYQEQLLKQAGSK
jgi:hypothetical protein